MLGLLLLAILITSLREVRSGGHVRTVDARNIRQIGQAALIYANENDDRLPEINLGPDGIPAEGQSTTVHRYAMALARKTNLNAIEIFISPSDRHPGVNQRLRNHTIVLGHQGDEANSINPAFLETGISYQLIGGLKMDDPSTTPVAFTRGLQQEGQWDPESGVHG